MVLFLFFPPLSAKFVPVAFGIKKLQITCVVEDDKVGTDILEEEITAFEDLVSIFGQSQESEENMITKTFEKLTQGQFQFPLLYPIGIICKLCNNSV